MQGFGLNPLNFFPGLPPRNPHEARRDSNGDPEEGDISNIQFRQLGPGRFTMTGTVLRTVSPSGRQEEVRDNHGGDQGPGAIGGLASMLLGNLLGGGRPQQQNPGQPGNQNNQGQDGHNTQTSGPENAHAGPHAGHRFTYTAGARLRPRDANNPGPHMEPVDELNK